MSETWSSEGIIIRVEMFFSPFRAVSFNHSSILLTASFTGPLRVGILGFIDLSCEMILTVLKGSCSLAKQVQLLKNCGLCRSQFHL